MSLTFYYMSFNFLNNIYMLELHLCMLQYFQVTYICWWYIYFMLHKKHIYVIVVPDICCSKNPTTCDKDFLQMHTEEAASLRKADTSKTVEFWTASGGQVRSQGARQKCAGACGCFSHAQEWSARPGNLETGASFVGSDVCGWRAWLVRYSILWSWALMWMLKCSVCQKQAVLLLAVWGCVCKWAVVEQPIPCGALMSHVVGAACDHDLYAPPRALPNARERGTLPTDRALHVPNLGQTPLSAIADPTVSNHWLTPSTSSGISELQVPHAYAEDESLWLAELWCEFIVQSISIYNTPTKIYVIWSVHLGCLVHIPLYHNCSVLVLCDRIRQSFLKWCGKLPSGTLPRRRAKWRTEADGNQNKCEEVCEPWNALSRWNSRRSCR